MDPVVAELEDMELGEKTRVEIWTAQGVIVGDVHAPHTIRGMKDRLSDLLNQPGKSLYFSSPVSK